MQRLFGQLGRRKNSHETDIPAGSYAPIHGPQNGDSQMVTGSSSESIEGFICPTCHSSFIAMDELLSHVPLCRGPGSAPVLLGNVFDPDAQFSAIRAVNGAGSRSDADEMLLKVNGYDAMKEGNEILRQELRSSHQQQQSLNEQLEHMKIANDKLQKTVSDQERMVNSLRGLHDDKQFEKLAAERSANKIELQALQSKLEVLQEQNRNFEAAFASGQKASAETVAKYQNDIALLKSIIDAQKVSHESLLKEASSGKSAHKLLAEAEKNVAQLQAEAQSVRYRLDELETNKRTLTTSLATAQSALEAKEKELRTRTSDNMALFTEQSKSIVELDELKALMASMTEKLEKKDAALDTLTAKLAVQTDELIQKTDAVNRLGRELESSKSQLETNKTDLQDTREKLRVEVERRLAAVKHVEDLDKENEVLNHRVRSLSVSLEENVIESVKLKVQLEELSSKVEGDEATQAFISQLREDKETLEKQLVERERRYDDQLAAERDTRNQLTLELKEWKEKLEYTQTTLEDQHASGKAVKQLHEEALMVVREELGATVEKLSTAFTELAAKSQQCLSLEKESETFKEQLATKNSQKAQLSLKVKELESKVVMLEEQSVASLGIQTELNSQIARLSVEKESLQQGKTDLKTQIVDLQNGQANFVAEIRILRETQEIVADEKQKLEVMHNEALSNIASQKTQVSQLEHKIAVFEKLNETQGHTIQDLRSALSASSESIKVLEAKLQTECDARAKAVEELRLKERTDSELEHASQKLSSLNESLQAVERELSDTASLMNNAQKQKEDVENQLRYELEQKGTLQDGLLKMQETMEQAEVRSGTLLQQVREKENALAQLQREFDSLSAVVQENQKEVFTLQQVKNNIEKHAEETVAVWEQKYKKLEQSLEQSEREKFQINKTAEELRAKTIVLENQSASVVSDLNDVRAECRKITERMSQQETSLQAEQAQLRKMLAEKEALSSRLVEQLQQFETEMAVAGDKYQTKIIELEEIREGAERKLFQLQTERSSVTNRIGELEEEKRVALNRCIELDEQKEKLQASVGDVRRKYEDSLAAMHELGRENQSLQVECARLKTRKWADDEEVTECAACGKSFGLTARKHHCRSCGEIFCNDCSAKTASLVAAKKPVRVCDSCFVEIQGRN